MKITELQLRKIIKEEIFRKVRLVTEAVDLSDIIKGIEVEHVKDIDSLKTALSKFIEDGGDVAKKSMKDAKNVEALKKAYEEQGGKPGDVDIVAKEIATGKLQVTGDVGSAAKKAAVALGNPEDANKLASIVAAIKGGKKVEELSPEYLKVLARMASEFIFSNKTTTLDAAKALSKAGAKQ